MSWIRLNFFENLSYIIDLRNTVDLFQCGTVSKHLVSQICLYANHHLFNSLQITQKTCLRVLEPSICHTEVKSVFNEYLKESCVNFHYTCWFQTHVYEDCPLKNLIFFSYLLNLGYNMSTYELNYQLHKKVCRRVLSEQNTFDPVGWLTRFLIKHST